MENPNTSGVANAHEKGQVPSVGSGPLLGVSAECRELLGMNVRSEWIMWARRQPHPKPSWLVEWDGLSEPDKEVDRMIGERLFRIGHASGCALNDQLCDVLEKCFWHLGEEIKRKSLNESARDGTQALSVAAAKVLDDARPLRSPNK